MLFDRLRFGHGQGVRAEEVAVFAGGAEALFRRYQLRRENSYAVDLDEVKRLGDSRTKILVVNSPHNPNWCHGQQRRNALSARLRRRARN
jgi:histidinol-phosphate/aromatic aminotransferase/cobyric acid decarboxylase-like protein